MKSGSAHCSPSKQDEASLHRFHSCNGSEARGLFVLLTDEEAFDTALATAYAERMRHGRSWSGYCLPAPLAPSKSPSDIALLEADLSEVFREFDGTGRKLERDEIWKNRGIPESAGI